MTTGLKIVNNIILSLYVSYVTAVSGMCIILEHKNSLMADWWELYKMERNILQDYSFYFHFAVVSLAIFLGDFNS